MNAYIDISLRTEEALRSVAQKSIVDAGALQLSEVYIWGWRQLHKLVTSDLPPGPITRRSLIAYLQDIEARAWAIH